MQPEEERHAAALKQEEDRHHSVLDSLNLDMSHVDVTKMSGREPEQTAIRDSAARQQEKGRHDAAVQQEGQRYSAAQEAARQQVASSLQPPSP
jgi:hypothetical protein